jgi:hypothetical protein
MAVVTCAEVILGFVLEIADPARYDVDVKGRFPLESEPVVKGKQTLPNEQ